jgi:hypothetical protein
MKSDLFVIGRQKVSKIRDCLSSTFGELLFDEMDCFRIVVFEKSNYRLTLLEHGGKSQNQIETRRVAP